MEKRKKNRNLPMQLSTTKVSRVRKGEAGIERGGGKKEKQEEEGEESQGECAVIN